MSVLALTARQVAYENRAFWRNPAAAFFTFAFPLIFMVLFKLIFDDGDVGAGRNPGDFFTPAIIALSVVTACYTNVAMSVALARDEGILKRIRGTPLPTAVFVTARMLHAVLVALLLVAIVAAFGLVAYGVALPVERLPVLAVTLVLGGAAFCAVGVAVAGIVPNAAAAPAVVNASVLPLLFISNVFVPIESGILRAISELFPIRHFAEALLWAYAPTPQGTLDPLHVAVVAAWGVLGAAIAVRFFTWEART